MIGQPIISSSSRFMCSPTVELSRPLESEATKLTFTICAVSLEPFRAVTLVGAWSVGAVGVDVARFILSLAFVYIWNSDGPTNGHIYSEEFCGECMYLAVYDWMPHGYLRHKLPQCTPLGMRTCSLWVPRSVHKSGFYCRDCWRKDPATIRTHNSRQSGPGSQTRHFLRR